MKRNNPMIPKKQFKEILNLIKKQHDKDTKFADFMESYLDGRCVPTMSTEMQLAFEKLFFHNVECGTDYYEEDKVLSGISELVGNEASVSICDEEFNPAWEYRFIIKDDDIDALEKVLKDIIQIHKDELQDVFLSIKDKEEEYL